MVGVVGYFFYENQKKNIKEEKRDQLTAIAGLKVRQIVTWRKDLIKDGTIIFESPFIGPYIQKELENPKRTLGEKKVLGWMATLQKHLQYQSAHLLDVKGTVRLSVPETQEVLGPDVKRLAFEAMQKKKVILSDLYRGKVVHVVRLSLLVPILIPKGRETFPVGVLLLRVDPYQLLYSLIQSWPTPSLTSETLLIRHEGEKVLFLNELRHRKNTALTLSFPITQQASLEAMAVRGKEGIAEGLDYREVPVLAALQCIPDSPWFLVAKVDQEEIYAPIRRRAWLTGFVAGLLILGAGLSVGVLWRGQRLHFHQKQNEAELERQALTKHFDYLTKYANDIILLMDQAFKIVEVNDRAVEIYGYSRDELHQLTIGDLQSPLTRSDLDTQMRQVEEHRGMVFETIHQRKDGTFFQVESSSRVIEIDGRRFYQSILRDITDRKRAEEELNRYKEHLEELIQNRTFELKGTNEQLQENITHLRKAEEQIHQYAERLEEMVEERARRIQELEHQRMESEKLAATGRMAAQVAHEINNPLAGIKNSFLLIKDAIPRDHLYYKYVGRIENEIDRIANIVRQMFDLYRPNQDLIREFLIDDTIREIVALLKVSYSRRPEGKIDIEVEKGDPSLAVVLPEGLVRQVLYNLIQNAIDASPTGEVVRVAATVAQDILTIKVSDRGSGIPKEMHSQIFEPFFTTKYYKGRGGLGLGLSISKNLVEAMRGSIDFNSEADQGTVFRVTLPIRI